ncbi:hypothetical protein [Paracidovorax citrulli]
MTISSFSSTQELLAAVRAFGVETSSAPKGETTALKCVTSVRPDNVHIVQNAPVVFVVRPRADGKPEEVRLERLDWASMGAFQRMIKRLLALFGKEVAPSRRLSAKEVTDFHCAMNKRPQTLDWPGCLRRPPGGGRPATSGPPNAVAEAMQKNVTERLREIDRQVATLSVTNEDASLRASFALRESLTTDVYRFLLHQGFSATDTDEVVRQLGLKRVSSPALASTATQHAAVKLAASRLVDLDCRLDEHPTAEPHLVARREVVVGDLHCNGLLLLHTLVHAGFLRIEDPFAWDKACAQLSALESEQPDVNWRNFAQLLSDAVRPVPGAQRRKLTLLGDVLGDRMHSDIFMLAILHTMAQMGLNYDCIFGNHDAHFLGAFLTNANKPDDEPYRAPVENPGTVRSLCRTVDYLNAHPEDRPAFKALVQKSWLPRLKVCSLSRDGTAFYSHAFANGEVMRGVERMAGADPSAALPRRVATINNWFQAVVASSRENFDYYYGGRNQDAFPIISPLKAMANNIGLDVASYHETLDHPMNAAPTRPDDSVAYAVHGHCQDIEKRVSELKTAGPIQRLAMMEQSLDRHLTLDHTGRAKVDGILSQTGSDTSSDEAGIMAGIVAFHLVLGGVADETIEGLREAFPVHKTTRIAGQPLDHSTVGGLVEQAWAEAAGTKPAPFLSRLGEEQRTRFLMVFSELVHAGSDTAGPAIKAVIAQSLGRALAKNRQFTEEFQQTASNFVKADREKGMRKGPAGIKGLSRSVVEAYRELFARRFHSLESSNGSLPSHVRFPIRLHVI